MMENGRNEFSQMLCKLYMTALLVALPLYVGEGYWNLGNTKYMLFRNVSLLCLGLWAPIGILGLIWKTAKRLTGRGEKGAIPRDWRKSVSGMDLAMAAYCLIVVLSAILSDYGRLAWKGYEGWFMGAMSQLLLAGTYFFISRQYDGARWPLYLGEAVLCLVTLFGLLHRLGIDPLGLLVYWNNRDWEYSHMLSTLGNINWLCGYYSVALAFLAADYLREQRRWLKALLYVGTVAAFVLLGVQGSQGGWLILGVCVGVSLFLGRKSAAVRKRVYALLAGFLFCMPVMGLAMKLRGEKAAVVLDGNVFDTVAWYVWMVAGAACLAAFLLCGQRRHGRPGGNRRNRRLRPPVKAAFIAVAAACLAALLFVLSSRGIDDSFGSGRGFLWRIALESFQAADVKDKLLGAGPDCYAEAVFNRLGAGSDVWKGEHWESAVFTNAHNEFLSQLCNVGILGTISYLAIFLTGLYQCWQGIHGSGDRREKDEDCYALWAGLLAIAMYGAHSLISFQQVLNAPFLFLVLGLCGERLRRGGHHEVEEI